MAQAQIGAARMSITQMDVDAAFDADKAKSDMNFSAYSTTMASHAGCLGLTADVTWTFAAIIEHAYKDKLLTAEEAATKMRSYVLVNAVASGSNKLEVAQWTAEAKAWSDTAGIPWSDPNSKP